MLHVLVGRHQLLTSLWESGKTLRARLVAYTSSTRQQDDLRQRNILDLWMIFSHGSHDIGEVWWYCYHDYHIISTSLHSSKLINA